LIGFGLDPDFAVMLVKNSAYDGKFQSFAVILDCNAYIMFVVIMRSNEFVVFVLSKKSNRIAKG